MKLVPPIYVKPFVKRQKNDAADAEAICEAASRPTMRFVAVKTREQQSQGMLFRTRDLLVRQRTQTINALRGHFAEFGVVAPQGPAHVERLAETIEDADSPLPGPVRELGALLFVQIGDLDEKIAELERDVRERAREDERTVRLMSVPGIGPLCAMAIQAFAPPLESFRCGRDFAAWLGLVPRQNSTGGKPKLGKISKMGQRDLRRLLVSGAMATVGWAARRGTKDPWLARMLARKPRMLVAVALANRRARIAWALITKEGNGPAAPRQSRHELDPPTHAELPVDLADVARHSVLGTAAFPGDLGNRLAGSEAAGHLCLNPRQPEAALQHRHVDRDYPAAGRRPDCRRGGRRNRYPDSRDRTCRTPWTVPSTWRRTIDPGPRQTRTSAHPGSTSSARAQSRTSTSWG